MWETPIAYFLDGNAISKSSTKFRPVFDSLPLDAAILIYMVAPSSVRKSNYDQVSVFD